MRKHSLVTTLMALLLVAGLILSACQSSPASGPSSAKPEEKAKPAAQAPAGAKDPYKIGFLTTLSGPVGYLGADVRDVAQMEIEAINAAGGVDGHPLELIVEDDGLDPGQAVTGMTKLIRQDKVLAVTGEAVGLTEAALRPIAEREQVSFVMLYPTNPEMRLRKDKFSFNTNPNEFSSAAAWIDIFKSKGFTKVAGIAANDTVAPVYLEELKKEAPAQGITVDILPDTVEGNAVDVTPQVSKLKDLATKQGSQAVVSTIWPPSVPGLVKTMKQLGLNIPVIAHMWAADNPLLNMGGDELNGLVMPGVKVLAGAALPDSDPQKAPILDFNKRYTAKTGRAAGLYASSAYDAIHMIANALKVSGPDKAKLRDALENTKNYVGVTGVFNYSASDHEGLTQNALAVYEIKNKQFVFVRLVK